RDERPARFGDRSERGERPGRFGDRDDRPKRFSRDDDRGGRFGRDRDGGFDPAADDGRPKGKSPEHRFGSRARIWRDAEATDAG
ncbi:hypothetical protein, partial [Stenotrophomonas maltophilia]|uniref:hypothetical protein n=1 Tax=Stenotrophomonas maltophilia TaxID=40324 RepID=UPI0023BAB25A